MVVVLLVLSSSSVVVASGGGMKSGSFALRDPGSVLLVIGLHQPASLQENTRRNATGNTYNTAPLSFNPMSHVASNARQSSRCGLILVKREMRRQGKREIKQGAERENYESK